MPVRGVCRSGARLPDDRVAAHVDDVPVSALSDDLAELRDLAVASVY
jgi:hypothetical protein